MTAVYSVLHLLVDGICALAMFGSFLTWENGYFYILVYNFCAFALQMPMGVLLDILEERFYGQSKCFIGLDLPFLTASAGVLCTITGAVTHPALLGVGNALFHVGGGVGCIHQDNGRNWKGRGLGIFVAPGALGLYLGTLLAQQGGWAGWYGAASAGMIVLCAGAAFCLRYRRTRQSVDEGCNIKLNKTKQSRDASNRALRNEVFYEKELCNKAFHHIAACNVKSNDMTEAKEGECGSGKGRPELRNEADYKKILCNVCLLCVVVVRSYIGMAVTFPWKTGAAAGCLAVLALVFGKVAGGFGAARFGVRKATVVSLSLAALCYLFSFIMPVGLAAVFLFNMTMPITLYWMVYNMPRMPGFAFGCLTFALFLGFLPGYFGLLPQTGGTVLGCAGCILSLLLLLFGIGRREA